MKEKIEDMQCCELLLHYENAIKDVHYNPSDINYNNSGYMKDELEIEVMKRMITK